MAAVFAEVSVVDPEMEIVGGTIAWLVKALKDRKIEE